MTMASSYPAWLVTQGSTARMTQHGSFAEQGDVESALSEHPVSPVSGREKEHVKVCAKHSFYPSCMLDDVSFLFFFPFLFFFLSTNVYTRFLSY